MLEIKISRLRLVITQPSQFLLRLRINRCAKKVVTLRICISGIEYARVTQEVLLNSSIFALSNDGNIIIL